MEEAKGTESAEAGASTWQRAPPAPPAPAASAVENAAILAAVVASERGHGEAAAAPVPPRRPRPQDHPNFKYHNLPHPPRPPHLVKEAKQLVFLAKIAEQAKLVPDMLKYTKRVVGLSQPLTRAERMLLGTAYERQLAPLRAAYIYNREVAEQAARKAAEGPELHQAANEETNIIVAHYNKYFVCKQVKAVCDDFMKVVRGVALPIEERSLLKVARAAGASRTFRPTSEAAIWYKKMVADMLRYQAEVAVEKEELEKAAESAEAMYLSAKKNCESLLDAAHPLRLAVMLNMAVYYHDVMEKPDRGCSILRDSLQQATEELDDMKDEFLAQEATMVLTVMRDNLHVWATQQLALVAEQERKREEWMRQVERALDLEEEEKREEQRLAKLNSSRASSRRSTRASVAPRARKPSSVSHARKPSVAASVSRARKPSVAASVSRARAIAGQAAQN